MKLKVIGISGSPIKNSNTDRALKMALEATGLETELIKLKDYTIAPCQACLGCVKTNRCVIQDDGIELAEKVKAADAMIVAGFTPYSSLDGRTKAFLERLYPLRHRHGFMMGKPGGIIVTNAIPEGNDMLPPAFEMGKNAITFYMMEEGMEIAGAVRVDGNVPCIKCGQDTECKISGLTMLYGEGATPESVGVNTFEEQPEAVAGVKALGEKIGQMLRDKNA